jgi:hypothetical protein
VKDVTIPLVDFLDEQIAEVEVKINGKKRKYNFRIESFPWGPTDAQDAGSEITSKIRRLKENIENYGNEWELVQIFSPAEGAKHIQVLFKQKSVS